MLSSHRLLAIFPLLLSVLVIASASDKIDGPFTKKLIHLQQVPIYDDAEQSHQQRFLDDSIEDIFDSDEQHFLNTWRTNFFRNHHNMYNNYGPSVPQYYPGWSLATNACTISDKKKVGFVSSIRECQMMCLQEASFMCRSVEYDPNTGTCSLSDETSASANYIQPCAWGSWLFIERINDWTDPTNACIYSTDKKVLDEEVLTLEECKVRCIEETDFVCHSVGYNMWTYTCSLSPENSYSPNFMIPCVQPEYTYVERLFVTSKENSCRANPCGPNSICWPYGNSFNCTCANGFDGIPPNCQLNQGCMDQSDCPSNRACVGWTCVDPCVNRCGPNAKCQVYNHYPSCTCPINYTGNPYLYCSEIATATTESSGIQTQVTPTTTTAQPGDETDTTTEDTQITSKENLCRPNPCGPNSICLSYGNTFTCTCANGFDGRPPNCQLNQGCMDQSDCPSNRACVGWTCVDPCVNRCGPNAKCQVYNHYPSCTCPINYTGNPYLYCSEIATATTESSGIQTQVTPTTTTAQPGDETDITTEDTQSYETTVAAESQTDTISEETPNNSQAEQDSDSTKSSEATTEPQTEPTMTETSLTELTDPLEVETDTVFPDLRRRAPKL